MLYLTFPDISHQSRYLDMIEEWKAFEVTPTSPSRLFVGENYEAFLNILHQDISGENEEKIKMHLLFFWDDDSLVGAIHLRESIEHQNLKEAGGHISYGIRPSKRGKGYAKQMLQLGLIEAKKLGLTQVLLTADEDNIPSWKTIESNGGIFERYTTKDGCYKRRYWITL